MRKLLIILAAIAFFTTSAFAGTTDTQTVYYEIDAINELSMDADATLTVDSATAGSEPDFSVIDTFSYSITTNETAKKITAALNANMPASTSLHIVLIEPTGGSSPGYLALSTTAQNVVTSIETVAETENYAIRFYSNVAAGLPADSSRVITFTLCDE
ncbi:MAG: hypothetical protein ABIH00_05340 [Armatimonadota bacterium]